MYTPLKRPLIRLGNQSLADRILPDVLPFLGVALAMSKPVMETCALETPNVRVRPAEAVFPKGGPSLDGEFEVVRRAEQMEVVRHQQVIRHQPGRCQIPPDCVQAALHCLICKPALPLLGANRQKDPIGPGKADLHALGRSRTLRSGWRFVLQASLYSSSKLCGKARTRGRDAARPYRVNATAIPVERRCFGTAPRPIRGHAAARPYHR